MRSIYLTTALICLGWTVKAQDSLKTVQLDDVVVTGFKSETTVEKSGKTIFKLTRQQIESNQGKTIPDLLNEIPGVQINGNFAAPGNNIGYSIRGADSRQSLILIDGVPFNDPSGISQTFDLRYLDLDQVESIEVLKGGLSTLYGTGAAAGVISITLKDAARDALSGTLNLGYGSFNSLNTGGNVSGKTGALTYLVSANYQTIDGFSAARDESGTGDFDDDGMESLNFLGKFGYSFSSRFSLGLTASMDDIMYDYDGGAFFDNNSFAEQQQVRVGLSPTLKWQGGTLKGDFFYLDIDRLFNSPDFFDPSARFVSELGGSSFQSDIVLDQNLTENLKLIGGINHQVFNYEQVATDDLSFNMIDPYATILFDQGGLNVQAGARLNIHSEYGSNFVWNLNPSYSFDLWSGKLKLLSSYSTSFITPTLFQLLSPDFGNAELDPEESQSFEAGVEILSDRQYQLGAVYFYRKDKNAIGFQSFFDVEGTFIGGEYFNQSGESEVDGLELSGSYSFTPKISLSGHYTYINSLTNGVDLIRVPQDKFGFSLSLIPIDNMTVKLTHLHTGETNEIAFPENVVLDSYNLFDAFVSYDYGAFTISASVNNLMDEDYEPILGFNAVQRNYNFGIRYKF